MKQTTNMARVIGEIQRIARLINKDWFNGELPMDEAIFTCSTSVRSYAHFTPWIAYRIHDKQTGDRGGVEIALSSVWLDCRDISEAVASLIHEFSHWVNWLKGVKDTSNNNVYHNRKFKEEAEKHGIIIEQAVTIGWSVTTPSDELIEWCLEQGLEEFRLGRYDFESYSFGTGGRTGNAGMTTPTPPRKSNSHKLICPCCGVTVRYTTSKTPNILCGDCNEQMIDG